MKNITYGYVRISTMKQKLQRQIDNIKAIYPDAIIIDETYTGTTTDRPNWNSLIKRVKKDAKTNNIRLVFDEVSRMSRNAEEGYTTYEELFNMGVELEFIKEPYLNTDTVRKALNNRIEVSVNTGSNATDDLMKSIIDALNKFAMDMVKENIRKAFDTAQAEVDYLHKRTSEGVKAAQRRYEMETTLGVPHEKEQVGRKPGATVTTKKSMEVMESIKKYSKDFDGTLSDIEVMKLVKCARNTYYKCKKQLSNIQ